MKSNYHKRQWWLHCKLRTNGQKPPIRHKLPWIIYWLNFHNKLPF